MQLEFTGENKEYFLKNNGTSLKAELDDSKENANYIDLSFSLAEEALKLPADHTTSNFKFIVHNKTLNKTYSETYIIRSIKGNPY